MKLIRFLAVAAMVVMLASSAAQAGFYAGFQVGPNFPMNSGSQITAFGQTFNAGNMRFATGFLFGAQAGFDFLGENFSFPHWAKYFTVAIDFQFNDLHTYQRGFSAWNGNNFIRGRIPSSRGIQNALSFLGMVKAPLMVSKDYTQGRLFPYFAFGPSIVWTEFVNDTASSVGFLLEPGVRFMFTPRISGDLAYRFRYCRPSFTEVGDASKVAFDSSNSSLVLRVNYHF